MLTVSVCYAYTEGNMCTLKAGSKVMQVLPGNHIKPIIVPKDIDVKIGPTLTDDLVKFLDSLPVNKQNGVSYAGGSYGVVIVNFGQGPMAIFLLIKDGDAINCVEPKTEGATSATK